MPPEEKQVRRVESMLSVQGRQCYLRFWVRYTDTLIIYIDADWSQRTETFT